MRAQRFAMASVCTAVLAAGQPAQVSITAQVSSEIVLQVEHPLYGPFERQLLPVGTPVGFPGACPLRAQSGVCTAQTTLSTHRDTVSGNPTAQLRFDVHLPTLGTLSRADVLTAGEVVFTLRADQPTRGTLLLVLDTSNSQGPTTLGDLFVDVGDDSVWDAAAPGQCACVRTFEAAVAPDPIGVRVRVLHTGSSYGTPQASSDYHAGVQLVYLDGISPVERFRHGCTPMQRLRLANGDVAFEMTAAPQAGDLFFLALGTPLPPSVPMAPLRCDLACQPLASRWLPVPFVSFRPVLLPPGMTMVAQGFLVRGGEVLPSDSWQLG